MRSPWTRKRWRVVKTRYVPREPLKIEGLLWRPEEPGVVRNRWEDSDLAVAPEIGVGHGNTDRGWWVLSDYLKDQHIDLEGVEVKITEADSLVLDLHPHYAKPRRRYKSLKRRGKDT